MDNITICINDKAFHLMEGYVNYISCLPPLLRAKFGDRPTGKKEEEYKSLIVTTFIKKMIYDLSDVDYDELDF